MPITQRLVEGYVSEMVFDVLSFLVGVAAGALTGALAGVLHGLERTADVQERLRLATKKIEQVSNTLPRSGTTGMGDSTPKIDELQLELDEINEEIKRMYKRSTR